MHRLRAWKHEARITAGAYAQYKADRTTVHLPVPSVKEK